MVSCLTVSNVLLMVVRLDVRTEPIHENKVISRHRGRRSSLDETCAIRRIDTRSVGFEVLEHRRPADTASWSFHDGDRANLF